MMGSLEIPPVGSAALGAGVEDWVATALGARARVGVGVDLVDTNELADMIESSGQSFMDLCWTHAEQSYCAGSITRLAARWAAKEATMKALGRGIGEVDPIDIEVVSVEGEPPLLRLHGGAEAAAQEQRMSHLAVSLTHEGDFAVAFVVIMCEALDPETGAGGSRKGGEDSSCGSWESRD